ncbi:MAG: PqqD family protein [Proteobacteria bacterium]|nr:PqqD family protein [Pseudomonadota bacterium]
MEELAVEELAVEERPVGLSESAVFTRIDEASGVVLELGRKRYYLLNETATALVELLERASAPLRPSQLVAELLAAFEVDEGILRTDVEACLRDLQARRLLATDAPAVPTS